MAPTLQNHGSRSSFARSAEHAAALGLCATCATGTKFGCRPWLLWRRLHGSVTATGSFLHAAVGACARPAPSPPSRGVGPRPSAPKCKKALARSRGSSRCGYCHPGPDHVGSRPLASTPQSDDADCSDPAMAAISAAASLCADFARHPSGASQRIVGGNQAASKKSPTGFHAASL